MVIKYPEVNQMKNLSDEAKFKLSYLRRTEIALDLSLRIWKENAVYFWDFGDISCRDTGKRTGYQSEELAILDCFSEITGFLRRALLEKGER